MYGLFLRGTYSRVLKLKKRSNKLAIAAFLKNAAIGPLYKSCIWEVSEFFWVLPIAAFLWNAAIANLLLHFFEF